VTRNTLSISVVIPAYNVEAFLSRAIESVLAQTLPPREIIIVDDGSTDRTAEVARRFGHKIRYIRQENGGASAARNRGIEEARCAYVAFLDADDEWLPGHLERAAEVLGRHPELRWFAAAYKRVFLSGEERVDTVPPEKLVDGAYLQDYCEATAEGLGLWTGTMVIRRDVLLEVGGFDTRFAVGEDLDLFFRIGLGYPRLGYSREVGGIYRPRPESLTSSGQGGTAKSHLAQVCHEERLAREMGTDALHRAEPVLIRWVGRVLRKAVREGDRSVLHQVRRHFGRRVPFRWRIVSLWCRLTPRVCWHLALGLGSVLRRVRPTVPA